MGGDSAEDVSQRAGQRAAVGDQAMFLFVRLSGSHSLGLVRCSLFKNGGLSRCATSLFAVLPLATVSVPPVAPSTQGPQGEQDRRRKVTARAGQALCRHPDPRPGPGGAGMAEYFLSPAGRP